MDPQSLLAELEAAGVAGAGVGPAPHGGIVVHVPPGRESRRAAMGVLLRLDGVRRIDVVDADTGVLKVY